MNSLDFFAIGTPKGQPRARAVRQGGFTRMYDPGTANDWKAAVRAEVKTLTQDAVFPIFTGPTRLDATFIFPRPKSHFRGKSETLRLDAPVYHIAKPDRDNCDKALMDALTDMQVLKDDCLVCSGTITKLYANAGQAPGVRVHILSLQETQ
jgi:Holliday junction resolvase RusA-like endonuclease